MPIIYGFLERVSGVRSCKNTIETKSTFSSRNGSPAGQTRDKSVTTVETPSLSLWGGFGNQLYFLFPAPTFKCSLSLESFGFWDGSVAVQRGLLSVLSQPVFQIGGDSDVQPRLFLNDVNPPVVHKAPSQQATVWQDFPRFTRDKLTMVLSRAGEQNLKGAWKRPLSKFWLPGQDSNLQPSG